MRDGNFGLIIYLLILRVDSSCCQLINVFQSKGMESFLHQTSESKRRKFEKIYSIFPETVLLNFTLPWLGLDELSTGLQNQVLFCQLFRLTLTDLKEPDGIYHDFLPFVDLTVYKEVEEIVLAQNLRSIKVQLPPFGVEGN